eukprot:2853193-Pleurochrysis_carterae.AAC.3
MAAKGCDSSAVGNCGGDGRRCFRRASWTLIGLLMFGYAIQLSDIHERRSAAVVRTADNAPAFSILPCSMQPFAVKVVFSVGAAIMFVHTSFSADF